MKARFKIFNLTVPDVPVENTELDIDFREYQPFGSDNLFISHLASINRKAPVHAGILKYKVIYILGKKLELSHEELIRSVNSKGESLYTVLERIIYDYEGLGNAYLEVITDKKGSFFFIDHIDATKVRVTQDGLGVLLHPKWSEIGSSKDSLKLIPLWPEFDHRRDYEGKEEDKYLRSVFHFKAYEPEFEYYGLPNWLGGLDAAGIAYKTNKWNISRLDNSFKTSGILLVDGDMDEDEAEDFMDGVKNELTGEGNTGKLMVVIKQFGGDDKHKFIPIEKEVEGDWIKLHQQSESDLIISHQWYRSLAGIADNTGFDTKRILNEYEVALNTIISKEQSFILEPIKKIYARFGKDISDMEFVNKPPISIFGLLDPNLFVKIHEGRAMAGLDPEEEKEEHQQFIKNGTNNSIRSQNDSDQ